MRFVVDECAGPGVARWLEAQGHDVISIFDADRGADDPDILQRAFEEGRILITADKDFGALVFRDGRAHHGVVLLRLADERPPNKIAVLARLFEKLGEELEGHFVVATEETVRISSGPEH